MEALVIWNLKPEKFLFVFKINKTLNTIFWFHLLLKVVKGLYKNHTRDRFGIDVSYEKPQQT